MGKTVSHHQGGWITNSTKHDIYLSVAPMRLPGNSGRSPMATISKPTKLRPGERIPRLNTSGGGLTIIVRQDLYGVLVLQDQPLRPGFNYKIEEGFLVELSRVSACSKVAGQVVADWDAADPRGPRFVMHPDVFSPRSKTHSLAKLFSTETSRRSTKSNVSSRQSSRL
uniref:Uncharacterized protein n=1 Tax=Lotharella globosa TaxID=91324 RepID=A0A6U2YVJ5_9EUKA|mmetsp:Transcript_17445/g.33875  ORF Transcript_17445/g.33875 Transcript_17445/m.33875 type:complete len:168 (-) Transcript_17445:296-799(-)|eukprot:CAMPEP_0167826646 /NCGR_PEP_ID=MMETSP0112_2-20121227/10168_1 /TAXON_ID=91324 /ORGANISM="Lotharella globosa, Strain CCCM811" /LENGTH=167 /DNA_ID=CAMNT_0007729149 /DNA_START=63 /DNA_END=566 /DNA_ORIENTATION=-